MSTNYLPKKRGELTASSVVKLFDNVRDENGKKLVQVAKRSRLLALMKTMVQDPEKNKCTLKNGQVVPIIVIRQEPKRGAFCYFNTEEAPLEEILRAFAEKNDITYCSKQIKLRHPQEMIANEAKQFLDDVSKNGKRLSGTEKLDHLLNLFEELYHTPEQNKTVLPDGEEIPLVVERIGANNRSAYCLNTSEHRVEVLTAFAKVVGCVYRQDKESWEELPKKCFGEMTARESSRVFHNVPDLNIDLPQKDASPRLVKWFQYIYERAQLNQVRLPDESVVPVVVPRQSHSQRCLCLNTSDELVKPFVIKRLSEITKSDICLDNLKIMVKDCTRLEKTMFNLMKLVGQTSIPEEQLYYRSYAQKVYLALSCGQEMTVFEWWKKRELTGGE